MAKAKTISDAGPFGVMWKTVSEDCNLACDYCYYSTCGGKPGPKINRIDPELLDSFMKVYMARTKGAASFAWQGGEPLLAGLDFFEEVVSLQAKYAPPHTAISNALQTNATLINDKWAAFFHTYHFLVGVSLDGPKEIHDSRRVDSAGLGSFDRVMKGIEHLKKHSVDFNILSVIHKGNVTKAKELMQFYEEQRFGFVQFIPCMDFRSQQVDKPGVYDITPEEYGQFLCEAFDIWFNDGKPKVSVRFFDNLLSIYANRGAELCVHRPTCPKTVILEQNGDAFPCDFYMNGDWKVGNVGTHTLDEILQHPKYQEFLALKANLPDDCRSCRWNSLCHGGCPRNRKWDGTGDKPDPDYFCSGYKAVYAHAHERMETLGRTIRKQYFDMGVRTYLKGRLPGRNEPCACGSGRKYKHCCTDLFRA